MYMMSHMNLFNGQKSKLRSLMGNDIGSSLSDNFSNTFSLFQLESKSYRTKQCWPYIGYYVHNFFL